MANQKAIAAERSVKNGRMPQAKNISKTPKTQITHKFGLILSKKIHEQKSSTRPLPSVSLATDSTNTTSTKTTNSEVMGERDGEGIQISLATLHVFDKTPPSNHHIAHAKAFTQKDDEINHLIKKITLNFSAKKSESHFIMSHGIFKGTSFHVTTDHNNLSLAIKNASDNAKHILNKNLTILKSRLAHHEINLKELRFLSCGYA